MKIVYVEPEKKAVEMEIVGDLKSMQALVGGSIELLYPLEAPIALISNEEGKLLKLPMNRGFPRRRVEGGLWGKLSFPQKAPL